MTQARLNRGFATNPGGRRVPYDSKDGYNDVRCGHCGGSLSTGAHIVVNIRYAGGHQLYCPECCPCRRDPTSVRPFREPA